MQQKCIETVVLWLLFPPARKSLEGKCFEDTACPPELIRYDGLWGRSWPYSFLCSSCIFINPSQSHPANLHMFLLSLYFKLMFPRGIFWLIDFMQVMEELGLIGLRIQRMPSEPGLEFGIPSQYNYMTVRLSNITFTCKLPDLWTLKSALEIKLFHCAL